MIRPTLQADAWATALLVAGIDEGLAMAQRMGLAVWPIRGSIKVTAFDGPT